MADSANYLFLPWVRQGAAAGIQKTDMTADQAGVVSVTVNVSVNDTAPIQQRVRLYGPGNVTGIDQQQIVRTEPAPNSTDFEPNYFPAIEFDRPDFPWLFSPAKADDSGRLRPWLCLIVVRKQDGVTIRTSQTLPLPVIEIKSPADPNLELPDLSESWAWAHAQIAGTARDDASLRRTLSGDPALTVSRLLCPRRLDPLTDYVACVVPVFELGRKAGLGDPVTPDDEKPPLALAWTTGTQPAPPVTLPIYFHWEFRTGTKGDFESLVRLLKARELSGDVGKRPMDISNPGFPMPDAPDDAGRTVLGLEGALRAVDAKPDEWPEKVRQPFQAALEKILNTPWQVATKNTDEDPIVGPPIYGCWQAARHTVDHASLTPDWLDELNLDPRHRAVAALGTVVVQTQQEQLVASAWEQLGEIERINQIRRQAQLGRAVNRVYYFKHFSNFSEETLLKVLAPAQSRIVVEPIATGDKRSLLSRKIAEVPVLSNAISAPMRRLSNPGGVISTRFVTSGVVSGAPSINLLARLTVTTSLAATQVNQADLVSLDRVSEQTGPPGTPLKQSVVYTRVSQAIASAPALANFNIVPEGVVPKRSLLNFSPGPDSRDADMFRKVVKAHQDHLTQAFMGIKTAPAVQTNMLGTNMNRSLLDSINPENTIHNRVRASEVLNGAPQSPDDRLDPILDAPSFPQPMYEALRDLSQDFLFPGLDHVPPNTVALLETNPEFVEAFLVGLNAEMSSELLWRNYPTDQRSTFFQQFWDTSVAKLPEPDIEEITKWDNRHLGQNAPRTNGRLVLLIRGELLRRYPNSVIYAVRAIRPTPTSPLDVSREAKDELPPLFRGTLKPDVTFLGFDLTDAEALGQPPHKPEGWFFVIQQQPTEPRFGLDVADFITPPQPPPLATWGDLSWGHLANTEQELKALTHASAKTVFPPLQGMTWGQNSAHQAFITLQRPVRIAIHARQMIADA